LRLGDAQMCLAQGLEAAGRGEATDPELV
jgi:hypothetical protein